MLLGGFQQAKFTSSTKGARLEIANVELNENAKFDSIGTDHVFYRLNNMTEAYLIRQQKEGYRTTTFPITKTKFNNYKFIDIGIPLIADILLLSQIGKQEGEGANTGTVVGAFFVGTLGWLITAVGPGRTFDKFYTLPALHPLPGRKENERYLFVDKVSMKIDKQDFKRVYYESLKDYHKSKSMYTGSEAENVEYENLVFDEDLNEILTTYQYTDTTKKLLTNSFNSYKINCHITQLSQNTVGNLSFLELTSKWQLADIVNNNEVISKTITAKSNWDFYKSGDTKQMGVLIVDALESSLIDFLNSGEVKDNLKSLESSFTNNYNSWEPIAIKGGGKTAASISEAARAVVTVKTKIGHGSGCIISRDGYIVTNYHVTGDKPEDMEIIFEDEKKMKAEVVRTNPIYDLALLKIEPVDLKPLQLSSSESIEIGNEVYAIGTPSNIELGQTVTKGIISGKRKNEDKTYIQTDVSVNKGSSGGALINKEGTLIGVVNSKLIGLGVEGVSFAIPTHYIEKGLKIKINSN